MKRALVLDANQRSALAVSRSLGKQAISVFTAEETPTALAGCSRFSDQYFSYPSPKLHPDLFITAISSLVENQHIDILLPMTELTTTLLLVNQTSFPDTVIPCPDIETVDSLADKCSLMRLAEELNITTPHTWYAENSTILPWDLMSIPYPIVLKPGKSWLPQNGQWARYAVRIANSPSEAKDILNSDPAFLSHPFMIQEFVSGHGQGVFALYNNGQAVSFFAHRRLREKPPSGGVSVLSESIKADPKLLSDARLLLDKADWHGVAMVEFKVAKDGTAYLMEINTRFWGSLQLAIDSGIDFPCLLYKISCGEEIEPEANYRIGRRLRWLLGDIDSLYLTLRGRRYTIREKFSAILQFITPRPFKTRHEVNRLDDLGPFWHELKNYVKDINR